MELKTKYQYTYFIYPYIIDKNSYNKYLLKLLKNKNCSLRIFEKEKDLHLYEYFLPNIRDYMFWTFNLSKNGLKSFTSLDLRLKANLLAEKECNIFSYKLSKDLQGKVGENNGIFFDVSKMKIICFKTGVCFLIFKTSLLDSSNFTDILNFNYKFREINSETYSLKEYENIRLQSDIFRDVKNISEVIKEIVGNNKKTEKANIDNERFITYSYTCVDQNSWNEETELSGLNNLFEKYRMFLPANKQASDINDTKMQNEIYENEYVRYGFSNTGTVLLTSDINTANYTTVSQKFESEYLYTYILELYKKILLQKMNSDFNKTNNFKVVERDFLSFAKTLWIQEITNHQFGKMLYKKWENDFEIEEIFLKLKNKYDILYKKYNITESSEKNAKLVVVVVILIVIGIINLLLQLR